MKKKEEKNTEELLKLLNENNNQTDYSLWILLFITLMGININPAPSKIINVYLGDD
ncbi:MAG: hypothetical protein IKU37_01185 [Candidatus Gastranaerophilales bacterium]|nr:hypothetical protein [Candidatus Gastranaerophilales bacterium]